MPHTNQRNRKVHLQHAEPFTVLDGSKIARTLCQLAIDTEMKLAPKDGAATCLSCVARAKVRCG